MKFCIKYNNIFQSLYFLLKLIINEFVYFIYRKKKINGRKCYYFYYLYCLLYHDIASKIKKKNGNKRKRKI